MEFLVIPIMGILGAILNRSRGAWIRMYVYDSGTLARFVWAVPTALVILHGLGWTPLIVPYLENPIFAIIVFLSSFLMTTPGSGAHSVMNFNLWKEQWAAGATPDDTENYTKPILEWLYGKNNTPTEFWYDTDFVDYHMIGKGIEGVLRGTILALPICFMEPLAAFFIVIQGVLWGPLFVLGWEIDSKHGWAWGELLTGGLLYVTLALVFFV